MKFQESVYLYHKDGKVESKFVTPGISTIVIPRLLEIPPVSFASDFSTFIMESPTIQAVRFYRSNHHGTGEENGIALRIYYEEGYGGATFIEPVIQLPEKEEICPHPRRRLTSKSEHCIICNREKGT